VISWRYHLVTIVAVFLALGLGLLMGTALLNDALVESLRSQTGVLQSELADLRSDFDRQRDTLRSLVNLGDQSLPFLVEERLAGRDVVLLTHDGVDDAALASARQALELSGARVVTTLWVQPRMTAASPVDATALIQAAGLPTETAPEDVPQLAAESLAGRLAGGPDSADPDRDILGRLLSEGFVIADSPEITSVSGVGGPTQTVVVVGGNGGPAVVRPADVLLPIVARLRSLDLPVAVGEASDSDSGFVQSVRDAVDDSGPLVTVDDLELAAGGAALVLGLDRALETGQGGAYGIGQGAQRLLPPAA
jgi:hypothetical protein